MFLELKEYSKSAVVAPIPKEKPGLSIYKDEAGTRAGLLFNMLFGELTNLCLVIVSGYVLYISWSPPSGLVGATPPTPTLRSPGSVWNEFLIVRVFSNKITPVKRVSELTPSFDSPAVP